jgi:hypothetical protein
VSVEDTVFDAATSAVTNFGSGTTTPVAGRSTYHGRGVDMASPTAMGKSNRERGTLRRGGIVALVLGLLGIAAWAAIAAFSASYGTDVMTPDGPIESVGVEDPQNEPDRVTARTGGDHGPVVWEGTWAELDALEDEAMAAEQASLRRTWLYPSSAVALFGVTLLVISRPRRRRTEEERRQGASP